MPAKSQEAYFCHEFSPWTDAFFIKTVFNLERRVYSHTDSLGALTAQWTRKESPFTLTLSEWWGGWEPGAREETGAEGRWLERQPGLYK